MFSAPVKYRTFYGSRPFGKMAYGRRRRYRRYRRRRPKRYYKRRRYNSLRTLPVRSRRNEAITTTLADENVAAYRIFGMVGDSVHLTAAINDTGEGGSQLGGGSSANLDTCFYFTKSVCTTNVKNLMPHDVFYTAYYCKAKVSANIAGSGNYTEELLIEKFKEGLEARMLDADETSIGLALLTDSNSESTALAASMASLSPYDSHAMMRFTKITRVVNGILRPGEERKFVSGSRRVKKFHRSDIEEADVFKGYTSWILLRYTGSMGHDTTNTQSAGTMAARLAFFEKKLHQLKVNQFAFPLIAVSNDRDTVTALEGPSEFSDVPDDE